MEEKKALIIIHKFRKQQKRDDKVAGILPKGHVRLSFLAILAVERGLNDPADGEWT